MGRADSAAYDSCLKNLGYTRIEFDDAAKTKFSTLKTDAEKVEFLKNISTTAK